MNGFFDRIWRMGKNGQAYQAPKPPQAQPPITPISKPPIHVTPITGPGWTYDPQTGKQVPDMSYGGPAPGNGQSPYGQEWGPIGGGPVNGTMAPAGGGPQRQTNDPNAPGYDPGVAGPLKPFEIAPGDGGMWHLDGGDGLPWDRLLGNLQAQWNPQTGPPSEAGAMLAAPTTGESTAPSPLSKSGQMLLADVGQP